MANNYNLPPVITDPYPYIAMRDLHEVGGVFNDNFDKEAAQAYEQSLECIQRHYAPHESTIYSVETPDLVSALNNIAAHEVSRLDARVGVIHLDKHIGLDSTVDQYYRLDVSRNIDNDLVSRLGSRLSFEEQSQQLGRWLVSGNFDEVVFMDDVLAFGNTLPLLIELARNYAPDTKMRVSVAIAATGGIWKGVEVLREKSGIDAEYLTLVYASPPIEGGSLGMAIPPSADLTIFGGKVGNSLDSSMPYILPFSAFVSIFKSDQIIDASSELLAFNHEFVNGIERKVGRTLLLADAFKAGFGVPVSKFESIRSLTAIPESQDSLHKIIDYYASVLKNHEELIRGEIEG